MATVDQAPQCGPSPGEGTGGYCEGVEELHWEGKKRYCAFVGDIMLCMVSCVSVCALYAIVHTVCVVSVL